MHPLCDAELRRTIGQLGLQSHLVRTGHHQVHIGSSCGHFGKCIDEQIAAFLFMYAAEKQNVPALPKLRKFTVEGLDLARWIDARVRIV